MGLEFLGHRASSTLQALRLRVWSCGFRFWAALRVEFGHEGWGWGFRFLAGFRGVV